jgi:hypothetical protein
MFDKETLKKMLKIEGPAIPLALVFVGKPANDTPVMPKKSVEEVMAFVR